MGCQWRRLVTTGSELDKLMSAFEVSVEGGSMDNKTFGIHSLGVGDM